MSAKKMGFRRAKAMGLAWTFCLLSLSCGGLLESRSEKEAVLVMSYNVQALFDAEDSGREYAEYRVSDGSWNRELYQARLGRLAEAILSVSGTESAMRGPDIACLIELENEGVLAELSEGALQEARYAHRAFAGSPGSALGLGVLSRYPILEARAHGLCVGGLVLRPTLEVKVDVLGLPLILLVCHWKSKLEGAAATERARLEGARLLSRLASEILAADPQAELLIAGDFNENPDEYTRVDRAYLTALLPASEAGPLGTAAAASLLVSRRVEESEDLGSRPVFRSPWFGAEGYSYRYKGEGERIDGFLLSPGLDDGKGWTVRDFEVVAADFLMDGSGAPREWSMRLGSGYSDHLPILLRLGRGSVP